MRRKTVSARNYLSILTGSCNGRTGWKIEARFCTMSSFTLKAESPPD